MPRTPTAAQIEASRINGRLSIGPLSPEGRWVAAANSTRHGLTGAGKRLPPDMDVELQGDIAMFTAAHRPQNDYERELIRRAALGNLRSRRLGAAANAHTDERTRNAGRHWNEVRDEAIAALADRLDAEPAEAVKLLKRTSHGCDFLGASWDALGEALTAGGSWDESQSRRALRLLGLTEPPSLDGSGPLVLFWLCVLSLRAEHDPDAPLPADTTLPDPTEARPALVRFVRNRVIESERLRGTLWTFYDEPSRNSAEVRAAFDAGPDAARLERYIKDAERMRNRALDELTRLRRDERLGRLPEAPAQNEPEPPARNEPEPTSAGLARPSTIDHRPLADPSPAQNEPEPPAPIPPRSREVPAAPRLAPIAPRSRPAFEDLVLAPLGVETLPLTIAPLV